MNVGVKQKTKIGATNREYPLLSARERSVIWGKIAGMWRNRKPDPLKELSKMRREWDRTFPRV